MIDEAVPYRIKKIYDSVPPQEQYYLRKILEEIAFSGDSETYRDIWLADYKEIPVDIDTFMNDELYLGKATRNGESIYPFWRKTLNEIFDAGNKYEEIFFTGATRTGKSSTGITATAYMLYRLQCLRDPQAYFDKKDVSIFSILFFNITKDMAAGVAFREFNDTLKTSPWFNMHGKFSASERNFYYIPEGNKVSIDYGSDAAHGLGKQVYCLVGDTQVVTDAGLKPLAELCGQSRVRIAQLDSDHIIYVPAVAMLTDYVNETIRVTLEDGSIVEGTSDHRIMLADHTYAELGNIQRFNQVLTIPSVSARTIVKSTVVTVERITHKHSIPVYDIINAEPHHNFLVHGASNIVSHNCGFMDEMNFAKAGVKDVQKAKAHMKDLYNTVAARVKGTFRMGGEVYGKIIGISSKKSDSDFMETYMQDQVAAGAGDHMYIADAPQWEVLPPSMFKPEKFYIAVGDKYKKGFVVPEQQTFPEALEELKQQGYTLLQPPIDMKSEFLADFDIALRDLAGISIPGTLSFITQDQVSRCIGSRKNPFYSDILQIGTEDDYSIEEFFHMDVVDKRLLGLQHFLHLDLSLNEDKTGISDICISGRKDIKDADGRIVSLPTFTHVFSVSIQAPRGSNIAYDKITTFIVWLRKQGFHFKGLSRDQFQSEYMAQLLEAKGFGKVPKLSLDRTPEGYTSLRAVLTEQRIDLLDVELLNNELIHLQRDSVSGRIDHPVGGSKDLSDTLAGSVWNAILTSPGVPVPANKVASAIAAVNGGRSSAPRSTSMSRSFPISTTNTTYRKR